MGLYSGLNNHIHALERVAIACNTMDSDHVSKEPWQMDADKRRVHLLTGDTVNRITAVIRDLIGDEMIWERWLDSFGCFADVEKMLHDRDAERLQPARELKDIVRAPYAFPGGYPKFLVTTDGACICKDCAKTEFKTLMRSTLRDDRDGWTVHSADINWESDLHCDHCSADIERAYPNEESA